MKTKWTNGILLYLLWSITTILGFLCLTTANNLSLLGLSSSSLNRWEASLMAQFIFLVLGLLWFSLVIVAESRYRKSVTRTALWRRFSLVSSIELFFLSGAQLIPVLVVIKLGLGINWWSLLLPATEIVGGVMFLEQGKSG